MIYSAMRFSSFDPSTSSGLRTAGLGFVVGNRVESRESRVGRLSFWLGILFFAIYSILNTKYLIPNTYAQVSVSGIANNMAVTDTEAKPGDILVQEENGNVVRSAKPFDNRIIGVVVEFPVISSGEKTDNTRAVLSSGQAVVNVTAQRGAIKVGDFITSSSKPGVGQKADTAGFILGRSLGEYSDTNQDGQVPVAVNIGLFASGPNVTGALGALFSSLTLGFQNTQNFPTVLRYLLASIISLVTFLISAFSFVRFMRHGLEAIGRNPLAKKTIVSGMILNAVIVTVLTLAGFGIAVAIVAF